MPSLVKSNMAEDFPLVVMRAFGVSLSPTSTGRDAEPADEPGTRQHYPSSRSQYKCIGIKYGLILFLVKLENISGFRVLDGLDWLERY